MTNYISDLDTMRFGFKVAKIDDFNRPVSVVLHEFRNNNVKLVINRTKSREIEKINELEENGFRLMDIQITYSFDIKNFNMDLYVEPELFTLRDFNKNDENQVVRIARESFNDYGHYAADKRLDKTKCLEIYEDWARRSCSDENVASKIIVAEHDNQVIGYLSFKIGEKEGMKYAAGGMGAVSQEHRSLGVFSAIVKHGLKWGKETGLAWEEHNVISTNFPVNRSFIKSGFKPVDSFITFHNWL